MSALLHGYLVAWLFVLGLSLGALANLMVLALTGGRWATPVIGPWRAAAAAMPLVALLFLPIALGVYAIYPWAGGDGRWLNVPFFEARAAAYLATWCVFAWGFLRSADPRRWAAAGLIVYTFTISFAAVDWIGSLTPRWSSSGFGLVIATGQMLSAAAFGIVAARQARGPESRAHFHDLGNLLLMYVMTWAYLAYTQFLIIWSENLPREIHWYVPRMQTGWANLGLAIIVLHFALPFLILLSRSAKRSPMFMAWLAGTLLVGHALESYWLVMPSVRPQGFSIAWSDPLAFAAVVALWWWTWRRTLGKQVAALEKAHG